MRSPSWMALAAVCLVHGSIALQSYPSAYAAPASSRDEAVEDRPAMSSEDPSRQATIGVEQQKELAEPRGFSAHGVGVVSNMRTIDASSGFNLILGQVMLRYEQAGFGAFVAPRVKITPAGTNQDRGDLFLQQAYGYWRHPFGAIKVGKILSTFGRGWDYGFYGPLIANYNMKAQPDLGLSLEGSPSLTGPWRLDYGVQYMAVDGHSLAPFKNEQFFASDNVRRRNIVRASAGPRYAFGTEHTLMAGLSGETFELNVGPRGRAGRYALNVDYTFGPLAAFFEVGRQDGYDVVIEDGSSTAPNTFAWTGVSYAHGKLSARYHANIMRFDGRGGALDFMHQPGVEYTLVDGNLKVALEGVVWTTTDQTSESGYKERSLYLVATGEF